MSEVLVFVVKGELVLFIHHARQADQARQNHGLGYLEVEGTEFGSSG